MSTVKKLSAKQVKALVDSRVGMIEFVACSHEKPVEQRKTEITDSMVRGVTTLTALFLAELITSETLTANEQLLFTASREAKTRISLEHTAQA